MAEFQLGQAGEDKYRINLVRGYNLPMFIETTASNQQGLHCTRAGGCTKVSNYPQKFPLIALFKELDSFGVCPKELAKLVNGRSIGCQNVCLAKPSDKNCCTGTFRSENSCKPQQWDINSVSVFKARIVRNV